MGRQFKELTAFIDGSSLGNPGHAGAGILLQDSDQKEVEALSIYLGESTNNAAEYQALLLALENARDFGARRLTVFSDSELLVNQMNGRYRVKNPGLRTHFNRVKELQRTFELLEVRHVSRGENQRADRLAHQAASRRTSSQGRKASTTAPNKLVGGALSLNEVSLLPKWSDVLPDQVKTETVVAESICLGVPLLAASTVSRVTESFAAAVAQTGAMAVLRPSRSPQKQAEAVEKIKGAKPRKRRSSKGDGGTVPSSCDKQGRYRVGVVVHPSEDLLDHTRTLLQAGADLIVLEASLGHDPELIEGITKIKDKFPGVPLIAGDVTDISGTRQVLESGADGVKVGAPFIIGVKVPLFTAILDCGREVEKHGGTLVADVGTTELMVASSRIARAIGAGAHVAFANLQPIGNMSQVQILAESLDNMVDDLRMIMSCCGARSIEGFRQEAKFVRVRGGGEISSVE